MTLSREQLKSDLRARLEDTVRQVCRVRELKREAMKSYNEQLEALMDTQGAILGELDECGRQPVLPFEGEVAL
jgi:hypothetical protein